jgi:hypothetical protein
MLCQPWAPVAATSGCPAPRRNCCPGMPSSRSGTRNISHACSVQVTSG